MLSEKYFAYGGDKAGGRLFRFQRSIRTSFNGTTTITQTPVFFALLANTVRLVCVHLINLGCSL
jgi:hypothetical protein